MRTGQRKAVFGIEIGVQVHRVLSRLKGWAAILKRDVYALYLAMSDPRVPWWVKALAGLVAGCVLSPIDLIPDFIPVIGYLDDVILVPLGILLVIRLIPQPVLQDLREDAAVRFEQNKPQCRIAAVAVVAVWIAITVGAAVYFLAAPSP